MMAFLANLRNNWMHYLANVLLILFAILMLLPFVWMFSTSLRLPKDSFSLPPAWIPTTFDWDNYRQVFTLVPFWAFFRNSLFIAVVTTAGQLLTSALAAYAFARLRFPGNQALFILLMTSLMVPGYMTIVPVFTIIRALRISDTPWALILPGLTGAFGIFLLRQFFLTIPMDLEDAARIDGASPPQTFRHIMLPLAAPALSVLAIFTFNGNWNDFFRPLIFLKSWEKFTLPLGLVTLRGVEGTGSISVVLAGVTLSVIPVLIIFLLAQQYLIEGIKLTGIKG
jgi:multiple sugar transport system permease protein